MHYYSEDMAYRIYISDCMMILTENTAKFAGGRQITKRYYDQIKPKQSKKEDTRSGQEIADDIISGLTGKKKRNESV